MAQSKESIATPPMFPFLTHTPLNLTQSSYIYIDNFHHKCVACRNEMIKPTLSSPRLQELQKAVAEDKDRRQTFSTMTQYAALLNDPETKSELTWLLSCSVAHHTRTPSLIPRPWVGVWELDYRTPCQVSISWERDCKKNYHLYLLHSCH